jgi:hypothetical protein
VSGTRALLVTRRLAVDWEKINQGKCSGIVGDLAHRVRGGYHISRIDNPRGNYSIVRPQDRSGGPDDCATAVDMSMTRTHMIICTARLVACYNDAADPRRKYINAFNGWTGTGTARRWDVYAQYTTAATDDHKWHVHLEIRRAYAESQIAATAVLSVLRGQSVAAYLRSVGVAPPARPPSLAAPKPAPAARPPRLPERKAPPTPARTLARNDKQAKPDANVKAWQQRMITRGWKSIGKADGMFGPKTESVVKRFQARCRIQVDGRIGPVTWPLPWTRPGGGG